MLGFQRLYAVDFHQELLDELAKSFHCPQLIPLKNEGCDFPGIADSSIDFVFSFGVFVHLEFDIIEGYLSEIRRVLKPGGTAVIQYSDKSKPMAQSNQGFAENYPNRMRRAVLDRGFFIESENLTVMNHSAIIRFARSADADLTGRQVYSAG
jgi:ubiquinone/menaquinone biosynthesis C-methylase UbiE